VVEVKAGGGEQGVDPIAFDSPQGIPAHPLLGLDVSKRITPMAREPHSLANKGGKKSKGRRVP
jgi:hypothetical protein